MKENALRAGRVNKIESKVTRMIAIMIIGMTCKIIILLAFKMNVNHRIKIFLKVHNLHEWCQCNQVLIYFLL